MPTARPDLLDQVNRATDAMNYGCDTPRVGSLAGKPICLSTALTTAGVRPLLAACAKGPARAAAIAALRVASWAGVVVGIASADTIAL